MCVRVCVFVGACAVVSLPRYTLQSTSLITTLGGGASEKCRYSQSVVIPEVSLYYVLQLDGTLLWKFCRYSRIDVISAVVISEVDCTRFTLTLRSGLRSLVPP